MDVIQMHETGFDVYKVSLICECVFIGKTMSLLIDNPQEVELNDLKYQKMETYGKWPIALRPFSARNKEQENRFVQNSLYFYLGLGSPDLNSG